MRTRTPYIGHLALLFIFFAVLQISCGETKGIRPNGYVVVGLEGNPSTLDPRFATGAYATRIMPLLYSSLLKQDNNARLVNDLAMDWKMDGDRTHILKIRPDVLFHDGTSLTANDVKYTYDYLRDEANGCPAGGGLEVIESVETPDEHTVVFHLKEVSAPFPLKLTRPIVPAHLAKDRDAFSKTPVGSGPFVFEKFLLGDHIRLKRYNRYFNDSGKPDKKRISGILFRVIENDTTRMLLLRKGDLDLVQNAVMPYSIRFFKEMDNLLVQEETGVNYQYLGFNLEDPVVGNSTVRQAIAHAIDRQTIIQYILSGQGRPATGIIAPSIWAYEKNVKTYGFEPLRSKKLLDQAGYPDPDGDGPLVRFTISYKTSTNALANEVAEVIARQLGEVGIGVEVRSFEWGTFYGDIKEGNFQMYSLSWVGITDPDIIHYIFHSSSMPPTGANRGRYLNPRIDRLIEQSRVTLDEATRGEIFSEIQKILAEDLVYVSLWWKSNVVVQTKKLSPFLIRPGGEYTSLVEARWQ